VLEFSFVAASYAFDAVDAYAGCISVSPCFQES